MLLVRTIGRLASTTSAAATTTSQANVISKNSSTTTIQHQNQQILTIKDTCLTRLKQIIAKPEEESLRIHIEAGGCSGFSYSFVIEKFDSNEQSVNFNSKTTGDGDVIIDRDDYKIVINKDLIPYIKGSSIDYKESLIKSSFQIENPLAETKCGCGSSFSINLNKLQQQDKTKN